MWVCVGLCVYVCECCVYVRTFDVFVFVFVFARYFVYNISLLWTF